MHKKILILVSVICVLMCTVLVSAQGDYIPVAEEIYSGHTYQLFDEGMTWEDAKAYCEKKGGHLAVITSKEEQACIKDFLKKGSKNGYWLGGYAKDEKSDFEWITGEPFEYTNWGEGQPDRVRQPSGYEDKIMVFNIAYLEGNNVGNWNDIVNEGVNGENGESFTDDSMGFICEWDYVRSSFGSEISEWASDEIEEAYDKELIPEILVGEDLTQPITRSEFAAVSVKAYELMTNTKVLPAINNPFTDTKDVEVLKAYNTGITTGVSATEFAPNELLNREQAATMLTRVFKRATMKGWTIETDAQFQLDYNKPAVFADDSKISEWAKDSVYFMAANGIISGVGDNKFAPQNTTTEEEAIGYANATREQALIIATRMVENLK